MNLRMPSYPLVTIDPYFSIWSPGDILNEVDTQHWTGSTNKLLGFVYVDGVEYRFLGNGAGTAAKQLSVDFDMFDTVYKFSCGSATVTARFFTPVLCEDIYLLSRPVSYLEVTVSGCDNCIVKIYAAEDICLNEKGQYTVTTERCDCIFPTIRMGSVDQPVLKKSGDNVRIDYGYFYLSTKCGNVDSTKIDGENYIYASSQILKDDSALFTFSYDDIYSIEYFGEKCKSVWNNKCADILESIVEAIDDYGSVTERCKQFGKNVLSKAEEVGGKYYAELLGGAYRQVMAAHKIAVTPDGKILYISKENSSNGCAATVDVTYPSAPIFMLYNIELLKSMLRPVFSYANSDDWTYEFAPHDIGTFPLLNGQAYSKDDINRQMPIEECGNMVILSCAIALIEKKAGFIVENKELLHKWVEYLVKCGFDPENQLCTDDFAGHLAHNCNLSLKAICAIGIYAKVCKTFPNIDSSDYYFEIAKKYAKSWEKGAEFNERYLLAFDQPDTFSLKYNLIWDRIFKLNLFTDKVYEKEIEYYINNCNKYGIPLDSRENYTKSDWIVWSAALSNNKNLFERMIKPLWDSYNETNDRVPMTDWYYTDKANYRMFKARSVLGGFWIKLLNIE